MKIFRGKLFGISFSIMLVIVMLFSSTTVFAEEHHTKHMNENVSIAKTKAEMLLN